METGYDNLARTVQEYYPRSDFSLFEKAYRFAEAAHNNHQRHSGEPYIIHPIAVALILAQNRLPFSMVVAALLHDVLEDTPTSTTKLRATFGSDIAGIVENVTKLGTIKFSGMERYAENLRKMFVAVASDLRVIIIKLADRIHNLRTLQYSTPEKQKRISKESLELYAPIANRLGMANFRVEIEDLAFKHAFPEEYNRVTELVGQKYAAREGYLDRVADTIKHKLGGAGIKSIVSLQARTKHFFSLYKKLIKYDWDINRIWDLFAVRIIARDIPDCYAALGIIHSLWKPVKGRIKDYIAQPKPNGYRSLHTTVFCHEGEFVEFQIRTEEMHEEAQFGIAAHWRYDEYFKDNRAIPPTKDVHWVRELADIQREVQNNKHFLETLEHLKIDAFKNRIFCYTPKGDVIELPEDATPIDLAYAIHTDIGNKAVSAIVNEKSVSLDTALQNGDMVKIITDKNRKGPSIDWLKFVKTRLARERIKTHAKSTLVDFLISIVPKQKPKN